MEAQRQDGGVLPGGAAQVRKSCLLVEGVCRFVAGGIRHCGPRIFIQQSRSVWMHLSHLSSTQLLDMLDWFGSLHGFTGIDASVSHGQFECTVPTVVKGPCT